MQPDWALLGTIVTGGLIPLILWSSSRINRKQDEVFKEVKKINGRVTALETFREMHENSDNRRFESLEKQ